MQSVHTANTTLINSFSVKPIRSLHTDLDIRTFIDHKNCPGLAQTLYIAGVRRLCLITYFTGHRQTYKTVKKSFSLQGHRDSGKQPFKSNWITVSKSLSLSTDSDLHEFNFKTVRVKGLNKINRKIFITFCIQSLFFRIMQISVKCKWSLLTFSITCTQVGNGARDDRKFRAAERYRLSFEKWPPESQGQTKEELRLQNKQALSYQPMRERERESYLWIKSLPNTI